MLTGLIAVFCQAKGNKFVYRIASDVNCIRIFSDHYDADSMRHALSNRLVVQTQVTDGDTTDKGDHIALGLPVYQDLNN